MKIGSKIVLVLFAIGIVFLFISGGFNSLTIASDETNDNYCQINGEILKKDSISCIMEGGDNIMTGTTESNNGGGQ